MPEVALDSEYQRAAAECSANGHTWVAWDAPKLGMHKDLCTVCGITEPLHGDTDHSPAVEGAPR